MGDTNKREETSQHFLKETYYVLQYPEYDNGTYLWDKSYAGKFAELDSIHLPTPVSLISKAFAFSSLEEANAYCRKFELFFDVIKVDLEAKPVAIPATART